MRRLFGFILLVLAAIWLGQLIQQDSGRVVISYANTQISMSLWFALLALGAMFFAWRLVSTLLGLGHKSLFGPQRWLLKRHAHQAIALTTQSMYDLMQGHWKEAEKHAKQAAKHHKDPAINYAVAAIAAQRRGDLALRDHWLKQVQGACEDPTFLQASLLMAAEQYDQTQRLLQERVKQHEQPASLLRLLATCYQHNKQWPDLFALLPILKQHRLYDQNTYTQLSEQTFCQLCKHLKHTGQAADIHRHWEQLPRALRHNAECLAAWANAAPTSDPALTDELYKHVVQQLKKQRSPVLINAFSQLNTQRTAEQLKFALRWLKETPKDADLLRCIARLYVREQLWDQAIRYYETSLAEQLDLTTQLEFAVLLQRQNHHDSAQKQLQAALTLLNE